jgi:hypothetical protein
MTIITEGKLPVTGKTIFLISLCLQAVADAVVKRMDLMIQIITLMAIDTIIT